MFVVLPILPDDTVVFEGPAYGPFQTKEEIQEVPWNDDWFDISIIEVSEPPKDEITILKERVAQLEAELEEKGLPLPKKESKPKAGRKVSTNGKPPLNT